MNQLFGLQHRRGTDPVCTQLTYPSGRRAKPSPVRLHFSNHPRRVTGGGDIYKQTARQGKAFFNIADTGKR